MMGKARLAIRKVNVAWTAQAIASYRSQPGRKDRGQSTNLDG